LLLSGLGGVAGMLFVGGPAGPLVGVLAAVAAYVALRRGEDPAARRERLSAEADLPSLVLLLAAGLRSGAAPQAALALACGALPGAAADRLAGVRARLALGVDPVAVWEPLTADPVLAPLARTLSRAARSGARVADAVDRLSVDLARQARARSEEQARSVGVRAAVPLGLCLLPAFLLLGVVPVVAGLFDTLTG
jgi:Flp pilus assembly protein TadB